MDELTVLDVNELKTKIYTIRDKQVMLDSDLAKIHGYDVKRMNEQVKRNIARFPEDFMFQLTREEVDLVKTQIATSPDNDDFVKSQFVTSSWGGRRKPPYAFTEQGVYMLATVLKGDVAINQSIFIMRAFREMRHFIANNALLFEKISAVELRQLEYQKESDEKFDKIFEYISDYEESNQKIFFEGQIFDAFSLLVDIISKANESILLIDGYIDVATLNILAKKNEGVSVVCYTLPSARITNQDVTNFNMQYPQLTVHKTNVFHDRFLILDNKVGYHIGASLKDAGKKCFGINKLEGMDLINDLLKKVEDID